jgi:hypothetical protein
MKNVENRHITNGYNRIHIRKTENFIRFKYGALTKNISQKSSLSDY